MKLRIVSDLHLDFHRDGGTGLIREIAAGDHDLLIVAGDISAAPRLHQSLDLLMAHVVSDVVYVPGNHDYYGSDWGETRRELSLAGQTHPGRLTVLDQEVLSIRGLHIVGATLWFPYSVPTPWDRALNDFNCIHDIRSWVGQRASETRAWLDKAVTQDSIVVTHHLPHRGSVSPEYENSPLNRYFLHEVGDDLVGRGRLWVHGHTHTSMDHWVGRCRVVCNPLGYANGHPAEPNPAFRPDFDIEV